MFKTGIYKKEQLGPELLRGFWNPRRYIALDLYESCRGKDKDIRALQEHIIGRVAMANGSFKKTHARRFDEFDALALKHITEIFPADKPLRVHDMAVSDGRTSLNFFEDLYGRYKNRLSFTASDYMIKFTSVRRTGEEKRIIVDDNDNLIQIITPPFVFNAVRPESVLMYPVNAVIRFFARHCFANKILKRYKDAPEAFSRDNFLLICHECRELKEKNPAFQFIQHDIFMVPPGQYKVVRAMNILNPSYFGDGDVEKILRRIDESLEEGGLFVTGSNMDQNSLVDGGIYRKQAGRLELLVTSGGGSPVHHLIDR